MSKGIKSMKLNNKSDNVPQVNNVVLTSVNSGTYVNIGVTTHNHYNNDVSMLKSQYLFDTENNLYLFNATDENVDLSSFVTIGDDVVISGCITMHDIMDFYANGCIQQFYDAFCKSHSATESIVLARFLSAIGIEIWKDVECYGGIYKDKYMVSNLGRVFSLNKNKILKQFDNTHGYLFVALWHNNKMQNVRVNRLVALTFYGEPIEKLDACHSNTIKTDNRLFNLKFGTRSDNMLNPITLKKCKESAIKVKADKATSAAAPTSE